MIKVEFPYDFDTFVKINNPQFERKNSIEYGTIVGYTLLSDGITVHISGYKQPWGGEFLLDEITPLTEVEINSLLRK